MKKAGTELVHNRILSAGRCNARKPGWVNGALPENSGETVAREYCFNWQRIPTDPDVVPERNDCDATTNITVHPSSGLLTLNGNVVGTANINSQAVTRSTQAELSSAEEYGQREGEDCPPAQVLHHAMLHH